MKSWKRGIYSDTIGETINAHRWRRIAVNPTWFMGKENDMYDPKQESYTKTEYDKLRDENAILKEHETKAIDGCIRLRGEIKAKDEEIERLTPKPILFGYLTDFKIIASTHVPEGQIWFASEAQLDVALECSRKQIESMTAEKEKLRDETEGLRLIVLKVDHYCHTNDINMEQFLKGNNMSDRAEYLKCYGYVAGEYTNKCHTCKKEFTGDKRAITCEDCATNMALTNIIVVIKILQDANRRYRLALEKLSKLGNEPFLGNSDGNIIAQRALKDKDI